MTPHADTPTSRRTVRALGSAFAASALLVGVSACADEADSGATDVETGAVEAGRFEATAAYLHRAAEQSTAEGYRIEMLFSLSEQIDEGAAPLMSGEVDGDQFHYVMDLGSMMDQMADMLGEGLPPQFDDVDMTMEMAGDPETMYLRAPMFAGIAATGSTGGLGSAEQDLAELGDGWGVVDMAALGDQLPGDLASAMGGQGVDPQAVVAMIEGADDVEDLGADEVRDAPVHGLSAEVTMAELLEASGQGLEALAEMGSVDGDDTVAALYETTTPIDVWIDDDGYLRRMAFGYGMDDIAEAMGEDAGDLAEIGFGDMHFSYAIDMFDYGAAVDFEAPADAVDITDAFAELAQG